MKDLRTLHKEAISLMKMANNALIEGNEDQFLQVGKQAFLIEKEAALYLINEFQAEPTRSVLFRSAATMAFNIGYYADAEKLIYLALSGNLYFEIKEELLELLGKTQQALITNANNTIGIENAYLNFLKDKAVNIKLEPKQKNKYSRAIVVDYMIDFLKNIQSCFTSFAEVNFKKIFSTSDFNNFDKVLELFIKDSKTLCVDLKFASFGVSIVADTSIMNYQDIGSSDKLRKFKTNLFTDFTQEVILADYNTQEYHNSIQKKYSPLERNQIFSPIVDTLKEKSNYRITIVENDFTRIIKICPILNKQTQSILKPQLKTENISDEEMQLRRTFELTTSEGQKKEKILTENLDYAEFKVNLENIKYENKQAYFVNPYELKIIFDHGVFVINDEYYKIYVESKDYKELQKKYVEELIIKFDDLLLRSENISQQKINSDLSQNPLSIDELNLLDVMKTTIVKVW